MRVISIYAIIEQLSQVETVKPVYVVALLNGTFDRETVNTSARKAAEATAATKKWPRRMVEGIAVIGLECADTRTESRAFELRFAR
jgi:hypothetical protein